MNINLIVRCNTNIDYLIFSPGDILPSEAAGETGAAEGEEAVLAVGGDVGKQELIVTRPGRVTPRGEVTLVGR